MTLASQHVAHIGLHGPQHFYPLSNLWQMDDGEHLVLTCAALTPAMKKLCPFLESALEEGEILTFGSSEALWQAFKATNFATFKMFTSGGRFGGGDGSRLYTFFRQLYPNDSAKVAKKASYWSRMGGIVAKLAGSIVHAEELEIAEGSLDYSRQRVNDRWEQEIWLAILTLKYQQPSVRRTLLATGDDFLLELDPRTGGRSHWGGEFAWGQNQEDGEIQGQNRMGRYLMMVRGNLCSIEL